MKKKVIIKILTIFFVLFFLMLNIVFAGDSGINQLKLQLKNVGGTSGTGTAFLKITNIVIGALQVVGTGISIIMVTYLGLKYVMASAGEKADIKKQAVPVVTGAVILFSAVNIAKIIALYGTSIGKS